VERNSYATNINFEPQKLSGPHSGLYSFQNDQRWHKRKWSDVRVIVNFEAITE